MRQKKGFTLVELLVAMVCAALVLSMVSAAAIFLARMNDGAVEESQTYYQLQTLEAFVKSRIETDFENADSTELDQALESLYTVSAGTVKYGTADETVVANSAIEGIEFSVNSEAWYVTASGSTEQKETTVTTVKCIVTFDGGQQFAFVALAKRQEV